MIELSTFERAAYQRAPDRVALRLKTVRALATAELTDVGGGKRAKVERDAPLKRLAAALAAMPTSMG